MKDDRLTEYNDDRLVCLKACKEWPHNTCGAECGSCGVNIQAKQRLAELEDKIENGTLVELPCKVGDTLYLVYSPFGDIDEWEITDIQIGKENVLRLGHKGTYDYAAVLFKELGEHAFLTKAEAEKKLAKLKGEEQ